MADVNDPPAPPVIPDPVNNLMERMAHRRRQPGYVRGMLERMTPVIRRGEPYTVTVIDDPTTPEQRHRLNDWRPATTEDMLRAFPEIDERVTAMPTGSWAHDHVDALGLMVSNGIFSATAAEDIRPGQFVYSLPDAPAMFDHNAHPCMIDPNDELTVALYRACVDTPDDYVARKVLCDRLQELDEEIFGLWVRFIRYQIDKGKTWELVNGAKVFWEGENLDFGFQGYGPDAVATIRGGMIERVRCNGARWKILADRTLGFWPVREVELVAFDGADYPATEQDIERRLHVEHDSAGGQARFTPTWMVRQWPGVKFIGLAYDDLAHHIERRGAGGNGWNHAGMSAVDWDAPMPPATMDMQRLVADASRRFMEAQEADMRAAVARLGLDPDQVAAGASLAVNENHNGIRDQIADIAERIRNARPRFVIEGRPVGVDLAEQTEAFRQNSREVIGRATGGAFQRTLAEFMASGDDAWYLVTEADRRTARRWYDSLVRRQVAARRAHEAEARRSAEPV